MRSGALARIVRASMARSVSSEVRRASGVGVRAAPSGDDPRDPPALLLGQATPDAVAFPVLQGPGQAHLSDPAGPAVGQGGPRLLFRGREEHVGVDAVTRRLFLPHVWWGRVARKGLEVDTTAPICGHPRSTPALVGEHPQPGMEPRVLSRRSTVRNRTGTVLKSRSGRSNGRFQRRTRGTSAPVVRAASLASQRMRANPTLPPPGRSTLVSRPTGPASLNTSPPAAAGPAPGPPPPPPPPRP